ncbi:MAG: methyltransferase domain-containing protein [Actinomycetota bacterium]
MVDRALIFGTEAEAYDRLRPGYPVDVVDLIVADDPELAVDAGCGTGIAARQVIDRGVPVLGVEPDEAMAAVARSHGIETTVSSFEQWRPVPCDVVYAAQSWHWIDPTNGARVAAAALRPGGRWIGCWNIEVDDTVGAIARTAFERVAPELVEDRVRSHVDDGFWNTIGQGLEAAGVFEALDRHGVEWAESISSERLVGRLDSHSAQRMLTADRRRAVRESMRELLGDTRLDVRYRTEVMTARRA